MASTLSDTEVEPTQPPNTFHATPSRPNPPRRQPIDAFTKTSALAALNILANTAANRIDEFEKYNCTRDVIESDDEAESMSPIFDAFVESGGSEAILSTTNFSIRGFHAIWDHISDFVSNNWCVGRGRRSKFKSMDVLFMTLATMKHGGTWDWLGKMFNIKGPTFERLITKFIEQVSDHLYDLFVEKWGQDLTMTKMIRRDQTFRHFPVARYATDVTFQLAYRPSGNVQEGSLYYSGKHKAYGYKVECSVLPNGICIGSSKHYPGSKSDIEIMRTMEEFHLTQSEKGTQEISAPDMGPLQAAFPQLWVILGDKGYQGAQNFIRLVHPKKNRQGEV